jgi:hypothetical protein
MLPGHLIAEFWVRVEELLQKQHHLTAERARQGIVEYRALLDSKRVGDIIYHQEPEQVANTIAGAVQQGGFQTLGTVA